MSEQLWRQSREFPFKDKETLREAFRIAAAFEWAKGLPPPTAEQIADAMMKVMVPVTDKLYRIDPKNKARTKPKRERLSAMMQDGTWTGFLVLVNPQETDGA